MVAGEAGADDGAAAVLRRSPVVAGLLITEALDAGSPDDAGQQRGGIRRAGEDRTRDVGGQRRDDLIGIGKAVFGGTVSPTRRRRVIGRSSSSGDGSMRSAS